MDSTTIAEKLGAIEEWLRVNNDEIDDVDCEFLYVYTVPNPQLEHITDASFSYCMSANSRLRIARSIMKDLYNDFMEKHPKDKRQSFELFTLQSFAVDEAFVASVSDEEIEALKEYDEEKYGNVHYNPDDEDEYGYEED